jgi:hypothetical protein
MKAERSAITNRKSAMAPRPWTSGELRRLRRLYPDRGCREMAQLLGRTRKSVNSKAKVLGLRRNRDYQAWTEAEIAELRRLYPDGSMAQLAKRFGRSIRKIYGAAKRYGISKSAAFMAALYAEEGRKLVAAGTAHRFKPGRVPPNKGLRRPGWFRGRMRETQFRKGQRPRNWQPVGTIKMNTDGYLLMKVKDDSLAVAGVGGSSTNWMFVHRMVWEQAHGPIPEGYRIWWKDGDHTNNDLENLELLSGRDHMMRTSIHTLLPKPLVELMQAHNMVKREINRIEKARGETGHGEEQNRGLEGPPVRDARAAQGQGRADGNRARPRHLHGGEAVDRYRAGRGGLRAHGG